MVQCLWEACRSGLWLELAYLKGLMPIVFGMMMGVLSRQCKERCIRLGCKFHHCLKNTPCPHHGGCYATRSKRLLKVSVWKVSALTKVNRCNSTNPKKTKKQAVSNWSTNLVCSLVFSAKWLKHRRLWQSQKIACSRSCRIASKL